jgi:hypothetical protein
MRRFRRARHTAPGAEAPWAAEDGAGEATRETALKSDTAGVPLSPKSAAAIMIKRGPSTCLAEGPQVSSCCPPMGNRQPPARRRYDDLAQMSHKFKVNGIQRLLPLTSSLGRGGGSGLTASAPTSCAAAACTARPAPHRAARRTRRIAAAQRTPPACGRARPRCAAPAPGSPRRRESSRRRRRGRVPRADQPSRTILSSIRTILTAFA